MTTKVPGTTWDPLSAEQTQPRMSAHDIVCLHTMAGYFNHTNDMFHENGYKGLESHMGMRADGFTKQWQDLDFTADANGDGNHRIISIETEDHGPEFEDFWRNPSDVPPWTDKQLDKLIEIVRWCCLHYDIPMELVPDSKPGRRGIAYHRQGIDPWRVSGGEKWSDSAGKVCCGDRRIEQIFSIIIPSLGGPELDTTERKILDDINTRSKAMYKAIRNDDDADPQLVNGLRAHFSAALNAESDPTTGRGHAFRTALGDKAYDGSMKALTETGLFVPPETPPTG